MWCSPWNLFSKAYYSTFALCVHTCPSTHLCVHVQVTLQAVLDAYDPATLSSRYKKLPEGVAKHNLWEGLSFILQGEPAAPPIVLFQRVNEAAVMEAQAGLKGASATVPASTAVTQAQFHRYYEYVSSTVDIDAVFVETVLSLWHLHEALHIFELADIPTALRPVIHGAALRQHGQPVSSPKKSNRPAGSSGTLGGTTTGFLTAPLAQSTQTLSATAAIAPSISSSHASLLVTHLDGHKSLVNIPADRFLRLNDPTDVLARLAAQGINDVQRFDIDF
jgi:hypothetical protein